MTVIGTATLEIDAELSPFRRGLREAEKDSRVEGQRAGEAYGDGFKRGADGRLRTADGKFAPEFSKALAKNAGGGKGGRGGGWSGLGDLGGASFSASFLRAAAGPLGKGIAAAVAGGIASLGVQAAAGGVVALTAALAPLAGGLAALPALATTGGAALGTLALGMNGVADAIKNVGDPEKFSDAIATLSPEARDAALAFRDLRPALDDLQLGVQDSLFRGFADTLTRTADVVLPHLRDGLEPIAAKFGTTAAGLGDFLREARTLSVLDGILAGTAGSVGVLNGALAPLLDGLRESVAVGLTFLPQLSGVLADTATRFGEFLTAAAADGRLADGITVAAEAFTQIGGVLLSAGRVITTVLSAGQDSGSGLLATLDTALSGINDFLQSPAGQGALRDFFTATADAATVLGPVLGGAFGVLSSVAGVVSELATTVGPFLVTALDGLAAGFSALAPAAAPLGIAVGAILTSLTPVLPLLGEVAAELVTSLSQALLIVAPQVGPLVDSALGLVSALTPLLPAIGQLAGVAAGALTTALSGLQGPLGSIVDGIVQGLLPVVPVLADVLDGLLSAVAPVADELGVALRDALIQIGPLLPPIVTALGDGLLAALQTTVPLLPPLITAFADLLTHVAPLIPPLTDLAITLLPALTQGVRLAADALPPLTTAFGVLLDGLGLVLGPLGTIISLLERVPGLSSAAAGGFGSVATAGGGAWGGITGRSSVASSNSAQDAAIADEKAMRRTVSATAAAVAAAKKTAPFAAAGKAAATSYARGIAGGAQAAADAANALARRVRTGLQKQATEVRGVISDLEQQMRRFDSFRDQAVKSARDFASLSSIFTDPARASSGAFVQGLRDRLAALQYYATNLRRLTARGLDRSVLEQIGAMGPEEGRAYAAALVRGSDAEIKRVNDLTRQIASVSTGIGAAASAGAFGSEPARVRALLDAQVRRLEGIQRTLDKIEQQGPAKTGKATATATTAAARTQDTRTRTAVAS